MIDQKFIEKQNTALEALKQRLVKKITSLRIVSDYGNSADDNAQEVSDTSNNLSLKRDLEREVLSINNALKAIKNKKYGKCQKCSSQIEPGRLKLVPTALYCSECQNTRKRRR